MQVLLMPSALCNVVADLETAGIRILQPKVLIQHLEEMGRLDRRGWVLASSVQFARMGVMYTIASAAQVRVDS